ncbi:hypothetical protein LTR04_002226 [Oleoguttula sp. CCFEE 6159]|nr:hypothetical protein LTR04_002226 [Oleoguttula sp. CCFEE 6159]
MSAQRLAVITLIFPNPEWASVDNRQFQRANSNISYSAIIDGSIGTLSSNTATAGQDVTGLLYVPDLETSDICFNASQPYVPKNVTRQRNLPNTDYDLVALAPWVSPVCTLSYLAAARLDPVRGFIFYLPDNGTEIPPTANSPIWGLGDGGQWKSTNRYPVYAIPGAQGTELMDQLAIYSGNMTDVPNGHTLTEMGFDSRDYVRLFMDIDTGSSRAMLPSLWVFLLVVLGILLAIIGSTSLLMHWIQRKRRRLLQRRIADGEVDLEALGIKRLTVPRSLLDRMPNYVYPTAHLQAQQQPIQDQIRRENLNTPSIIAEGGNEKVPETARSPGRGSDPATSSSTGTSYFDQPRSQPTCAVCLDDFDPGVSRVRELPCRHIFHPECVDTFLRYNSSLCPLCKKSALPKGYCPATVTNAMVRRERMLRRLRERVTIDDETHAEPNTVSNLAFPAARSRTFSSGRLAIFHHPRIAGGRRISSAPTPVSSPPIEMRTANSAPAAMDTTPPLPLLHATDAPPVAQRRREWARQRALSLLGNGRTVDPDSEEVARLARAPRWRKAVRAIFPAVG